jgi:selenophosphate synthase
LHGELLVENGSGDDVAVYDPGDGAVSMRTGEGMMPVFQDGQISADSPAP